MMREVDILDISDGHLYGLNDMVPVGCDDCKGCSACCHGMGDSILLDPLDIHRMTLGLHTSFDQMVDQQIELGMVDGLILPHLKLDGDDESCQFLNGEGRCSIHALRPGICRIFPLGRYYKDESFYYILQTGECVKQNRGLVKVRNWVDTPNILRYDKYISDWHYFIKDLGNQVASLTRQEAQMVCLYVLKLFFQKPYDMEEDFYGQFYKRLEDAEEVLASV